MAKIISIHSYRGGTGKSNSTANLAVLIAEKGMRVGVIDTDIQSPGIHILFGLDESTIIQSLNDYLWGRCNIQDAAYDITETLAQTISGRLFLIPSSIKAGEIARVLREGYDVSVLNDGIQDLIDALNLDALLIDTHPGLNEETLLSIAVSDSLLIILRPDQQDYLGTGVTAEVARQLMLVNKVPSAFDSAEVKARIEETYKCPVVGVLHHADEMMALGSSGIFSFHYPDHPVTKVLREVAETLIG